MDVPVADKINIKKLEHRVENPIVPSGGEEEDPDYEYVDSWPDEGGW